MFRDFYAIGSTSISVVLTPEPGPREVAQVPNGVYNVRKLLGRPLCGETRRIIGLLVAPVIVEWKV